MRSQTEGKISTRRDLMPINARHEAAMVFFLVSSKAACAQVSDPQVVYQIEHFTNLPFFVCFRCVGRNRCCCIRSAEAVDGTQTGHNKLKRM